MHARSPTATGACPCAAGIHSGNLQNFTFLRNFFDFILNKVYVYLLKFMKVRTYMNNKTIP